MPPAIPTATYRLQLTKDFDFDAAALIAPYLKALGVSIDVFTSERDLVERGAVDDSLKLLEDRDLIYIGVLESPKGKQALQGKIRTIINDILKQKTGYGGVDNVYFTNFVIQ